MDAGEVSEIDGKPIKEYVDLPYGAFVKMVREKVDPLWGYSKGDGKLYRASFTARIVRATNESETFEVIAKDENSAKEMAEKLAQKWAEKICDWDEEIEDVYMNHIKPAKEQSA